MKCWPLPSVPHTERLASALARHCPWAVQGPCVLFLSGELGAGKTTLAAALLAALGVTEAVRSPTYALIEPYPISRGLAVHVDLYRLGSACEVEQLGLADYLQPATLLLIEWPERGAPRLPCPDLALRLELQGEGRLCCGEGTSAMGQTWWRAAMAEMTQRSSEVSPASP